MDVQALIEKAKTTPLTSEEHAVVFKYLQQELERVKKEKPEEYHQLLKALYVATVSLNNDLKRILAS